MQLYSKGYNKSDLNEIGEGVGGLKILYDFIYVRPLVSFAVEFNKNIIIHSWPLFKHFSVHLNKFLTINDHLNVS
jgi:hypothetical protein